MSGVSYHSPMRWAPRVREDHVSSLDRSQLVTDGPFAESKELLVGVWPEIPRAGRYAFVNGLRMYYELHGEGRPLILLHGALSTIDSSFNSVLPSLSGRRRVIAVEQQAHGRTRDIARPLSYEQMARDTIELLRQLGVREADVIGYSMGATVALQMAVEQPRLVRKLALVSAGYHKAGYKPELVSFMRQIDPTSSVWATHPLGPKRRDDLEHAMRRAAPSSDWPTALTRIKQAFASYDGVQAEDLRRVRADTLVLTGDQDVIYPEHMGELSRLLPRAKLEVMPGADHAAMVARAAPLLPAFLDAPVAKTPSRRR